MNSRLSSLALVLSISCGIVAVCSLLSLLKVSCLIGSCTGAIKGFTLFLPVLTSFISAYALVPFLIGKYLVQMWSGIAVGSCTYYLPTMCSTWYAGVDVRWLKLGLIFTLMGAFLMHPTGFQAAPYIFFWVIPAIVTFVPKQYIFAQMLGVTFVAHAVGTVVWLYQATVSPAVFLLLAPIVLVERCFMASLMTCLYYIMQAVYVHTVSWFVPKVGYQQNQTA